MYQTIYDLSKMLALAGWGLLILSLFMCRIRRVVWPLVQFALPAVFALMYLLMVWEGRDALHLPASFTTLPGIGALYDNPSAFTAGWLHFLALDMFAGAWIAQDGLVRAVPVVLLVIALLLTFVFAPAGLLLYILLRFALRPRSDGETVQH